MSLSLLRRPIHKPKSVKQMKHKLIFPIMAAIAIVALLLVAGCSKKAPAATPYVPAPQVTNQAPAPLVDTTAPVAEAPPELAQADKAVQDIGTSDLDEVDKNLDKLTVP